MVETDPGVASIQARAPARREGGREFQALGPDEQNDRSPTVFKCYIIALSNLAVSIVKAVWQIFVAYRCKFATMEVIFSFNMPKFPRATRITFRAASLFAHIY